jgi:hypothetical protein
MPSKGAASARITSRINKHVSNSGYFTRSSSSFTSGSQGKYFFGETKCILGEVDFKDSKSPADVCTVDLQTRNDLQPDRDRIVLRIWDKY